MYIDSQITGGDVYYVYTYKYSRTDTQYKSNFERNIKANIQTIFGLQADKVLSNQEKQEIARSVEKYTVTSNIIGYAPTLISRRGQLNGEIARVQNFLTNNPLSAATMEMNLRSYSNITDYQELRELYNKEAKCFRDWELWNEIRSVIKYLEKNPKRSIFANGYYTNELKKIEQQLINSMQCNNSLTPFTEETSISFQYKNHWDLYFPDEFKVWKLPNGIYMPPAWPGHP